MILRVARMNYLTLNAHHLKRYMKTMLYILFCDRACFLDQKLTVYNNTINILYINNNYKSQSLCET